MQENSELAPIVLFVYNRLNHTHQTIEALKQNTLAQESELYIYSDGPKNEDIRNQIQQLREYLKTINGFRKVILIERDTNWGLASSIIDGVSSVIKQYGKVIVLEDDLITSRYFLEYMNQGLSVFEKDPKIYSITGFSFSTNFIQFPNDYEEDIYLNIRPMSWSWATWLDRWKDVDWEVKDYNEFIHDGEEIKAFNNGATDLTRMLKNQMKGKLSSWYIRWTYSAFKREMLTVYPRVSYVNNIGHDASGVHCVGESNDIYSHTQLNDVKSITLNPNIQLDQRIVDNFNKGFNTNYVKILHRKFKKLMNKLRRKSNE